MAIKVTNIHRITDEEYKKQLEDRINDYFSTHKGEFEYLEIPIRSSAYHNNGSTLYPTNVCRELAVELRKAGFFCYWTRPSWKYDAWMDFCVSTYIRTSTQGNIQEI